MILCIMYILYVCVDYASYQWVTYECPNVLKDAPVLYSMNMIVVEHSQKSYAQYIMGVFKL